MRKFLLILACGAICTLSSTAAVQNDVIDGQLICAISTDGKYGITDEGTGEVFLINLETLEETYLYCDDWASVGNGNAVSNTGIVVGNIDEALNQPTYWENGEWHLLPIRETDTGNNYPQGITADGWRICGQIGRFTFGELDVVGQIPVYWERNEDGTYGDYVELPYPQTDFTGRVPQYVTAMCISDDGRIIAGQVKDSTGAYNMPIIYHQSSDGSWTYRLLYDLNPDGIKLPEEPGPGPVAISIFDYMSEEELAAYNAAYDEYYAHVISQPYLLDYATEDEYKAYETALIDWAEKGGVGAQPELQSFMSAEALAKYEKDLDEWNATVIPYPVIDEFLSDENYAAYRAAEEKYYEECTEWYAKMNAYDEAFRQIVSGKPTFAFNNVCISANGKYYGTVNCTYDSNTYDPINNPWVFDIATGEAFPRTDQNDLTLLSVSNDGAMLAANPFMDYTRWAWIAPSLDSKFVPLEEYVKIKDSQLYQWMCDELRHDYTIEEEYYDNDGNWGYTQKTIEKGWLTGTPHGNADFSVIVTYEYNVWDAMSSAAYYSYILSSSSLLGINGIENDSKNIISVTNGGDIKFGESPASVTIYDMYGRIVYNATNPGEVMAPRLANGLYIIKAVDAAGKVSTLKANL